MRAPAARAAVVVLVLGLASSFRAFALEGEMDVDAAPSATLAPIQGPGSPLAQAEATRITSQLAVTGHATLAEGLALSATGWVLLDSLPDYSPLDVPGTRLAFSSRVLQADVSWQIIPGVLIWDAGKQVIHPSSGFFRTPLNLLSRGPAGNAAPQVPAAAPQWEEGWIGTRLLWIIGDFSVEDFFVPRLTWPTGPADPLSYLSAPQEDFMDQLRVQAHVGDVDLQALGLISTGGPGSTDPAVHVQAGAGVEASLGERVTAHGEVSVADSLSRLTVVDPALMTAASESLDGVARGLAGFTWSLSTKESLTMEYAYNGLGFRGADWARLVQYARNRLASRSAAPDLLGQFGSFDSAQHYAFARLADDLTDQLSAQGWLEVNLQDLSSIQGVAITMTGDGWGLGGSFTGTRGGAATEAGAEPLLWQLDVELKLFF